MDGEHTQTTHDATEEVPAPPIRQIIYTSRAADDFDEMALRQVLGMARLKNKRCGITGMLLFEDGCFLQVIEGPEEAVETLIAKILEDPRHHDTVVLHRCDVSSREFGGWSMAWPRKAELQRSRPIPGWDAFLSGGITRRNDENRALASEILYAFRDDGRYKR